VKTRLVSVPPFNMFDLLENPSTTESTLLVLVIAITGLTVATSTKARLGKSFLRFAVGIGAFHVLGVLYGAPLFSDIFRTALWATLLSSLAVLPSCLVLPDEDLWIVFIRLKPRTPIEKRVFCTSIGAVVGTWFGAIPIPLDADRPWQVWPISCVYGALLGYVVGFVYAFL